ncbi:MAG: permease [Candidatus Cloacimonetes bacterium]|nr:permease [Candidatus Cloacimonadota bacterium]
MKPKNENSSSKTITYLFTALISIVFVLILMFTDKGDMIITELKDFSFSMLTILPAVILLMGLFNVWVTKEHVMKWLGKESGIKGIVISFVFGALPTGPLFVAFPIAATLKKKGASILNIVIFLSAWGCVKIPQEIIELQYLGLKFMLTRLVLTISFITIMGIIIENFMEEQQENKSKIQINNKKR